MSNVKSSSNWFETRLEDYWNSSSTTAFDFEDEQVDLENLVINDTSKRPTRLLVNSHTSDVGDSASLVAQIPAKVFDDRSAEQQIAKCLTIPSAKAEEKEHSGSHLLKSCVRSILDDLLRGIPHPLDSLKSMKDKLELLDLAISSCDGNAIIMVVQFLKRTLCRRLFIYEISQRPTAVSHFLSYLQKTSRYSELEDYLSVLQRHEDILMLKYQQAVRQKDARTRVFHLKHCRNNYLSYSPDAEFLGVCLSEYVDLLERQQPIEAEDFREEQDPNFSSKFMQIPRFSLIDQPVLTTLYYFCLYHYELTENHLASPKALCQRHNLSQKQFEWTALRALAASKRWNEVDALFEQKSLLGGRKIKSCIPMAKVVRVLAKHHAKAELLLKYTKLVEDSSKRLELAKELKLHNLVADIYANLRDSKGLEAYADKLSPSSDEYIYCQRILRNSNIRWKN